MPNLTISVATPPIDTPGFDSPGLSGAQSGLVLRVEQLLTPGGKKPKSPHRTKASFIPGAPPLSLVVPAGFYGVELILPSGRRLVDQVAVAAKGKAEARLDLGGAAHDWLGLQRVEGAVPSTSAYRAQLKGPKSILPGSPRGVVSRPSAGLRSAYPRRDASGRFAPEPLGAFESFRSVFSDDVPLSGSDVTLLCEPRRAELAGAVARQAAVARWEMLADAVEARRQPFRFAPDLTIADDAGVKRAGSDRYFDRWLVQYADPGVQRFYAIVRTRRSTELVSLPAPWRNHQTGEPAVIELVIDTSLAERPARTNVTVSSPDLFGVMAYLKAGALRHARTSLDLGDGDTFLVEALHTKFANPLAASASAYCLLATSDLSSPARWYDWINTLDREFAWLADGAVARAYLLSASDRGDAADARAAYLRAFDRGLPYFTMGLSWLLAGLRRFRDEECQAYAALVRRVAVRADMSQAVTSLSCGRPVKEIDDVSDHHAAGK